MSDQTTPAVPGDRRTVTGEPIRTGERAVHRTGTVQTSRRRTVTPPLSGAYLPDPIVGRIAVLVPDYRDGSVPHWRIGEGRYRVQVDGSLAAAMLGRVNGAAERLLVLVADGHGLHPYAVQGWESHGTGYRSAMLAPVSSADLPGDYVVLQVSGIFEGPAA